MLSTLDYALTQVKASLARTGIRLLKGLHTSNPDIILDIPSRDEGRSIRAHVYKSAEHSNSDSPKPVLINFHGSGWVLPCHGENDAYCRKLAAETGYTVIDSSYRLAPENPFPKSLNDVEDAVKYILDRPDEYDPKRVAISGFSAGANMALVAASVLFPPNTFTTAIAFYPLANFATDPATRGQPDPTIRPSLSPGTIAWLTTNLLQDEDFDLRDPRLSPFYADSDRFPAKVLLIAGGADSLCADSDTLYEKLRDGRGREVVYRKMEGCNHGWDTHADLKAGSLQEEAKKEVHALAVRFLLEVRPL